MATRLDAASILAGEEERGMANFLEYNPGASLFAATNRERSAGRRASLLFRAWRGGEAGFAGA